MPFSVTPTNQVDIDMSDAGPDDFLVLTLEDRSRIYLRKQADNERFPRLVFDEQLLPAGFRAASLTAAQKMLRLGMNTVYSNDLKALKQLYESRQDRSLTLREFISMEIRRDAYVSAKKPRSDAIPRGINIGEVVSVSFSRKVGDISFSTSGDDWVAPAPIARIEPIERFAALLEEARQGEG